MNNLLYINQWDQQPGESSRAFEAFQSYRDMGAKRSHASAFKLLKGKDNSRGRFDVWSVKNDWVNRVNAYDRWIDQQYTNGMALEVKEMGARHARTAVSILNKVIDRLLTIRPEDLSPDQLIRWFEIGSRIERQARGEPSEIVRTENNTNIHARIDLSKLSDDEFDQVHTIIVRAVDTRRSLAGAIETTEG